MKHTKVWALSIVAAVLLAACGGGDPYVPGTGSPSGAPTTKGTFSAVVSFGDSLSDIGAYTPATAIPGTSPAVYLGGKFSTNFVSVWPWHLELSHKPAEHCVHGEHGGRGVHSGDGGCRALSERGRGDCRDAQVCGGLLDALRQLDLLGLSRRTATCGAATPRCGCSTA
jgi:hypothetical protein